MKKWTATDGFAVAAALGSGASAGLFLVVLDRAIRFVGSPSVWAGTSEKPQQLFGKTLPGGFDCSGFVWRVYKTRPFAGAPELSRVLVGRTTYAMSGEVGLVR